jgi:pyruvate/2-oxoglutarate dehydrogenase complex dihydrolipoamide acyltransferase (E2) component
VLAHNLKDRQGADVVPWALLALLYRSQGEAHRYVAAAGQKHTKVHVLCQHAVSMHATPCIALVHRLWLSGCQVWNLPFLRTWCTGKAKEASARSCHQEVLRQSKAAKAAAAAAEAANTAAAAAAAAAACASAPDNGAAAPSDAVEPVQQPAAPVPVADVMPAANGYLAAAELVLQLNLPGLGLKLLELATGVNLCQPQC